MSETVKTTIDIPVLIVGAGPVGLALAGDLGWRGQRCLLVERSDGGIYQPRMDMVGIRTMEFCRRWGIVDEVENSPYPRDYRQDNVYLTALTDYELGRERMPSMGESRPPEQSPQKRERCPQNMFDPILARFVRSRPTVMMRYRTEVVALADHGDHVEARLRDLDSGRKQIVRAAFAVGCDGAASMVRRAAGIEMVGNPALTYTTNIIFRCPHLASLHDKEQAYRHIFIGPEGTWATIVAINGRDQWRMSIIGDLETRERTEAEIHDAIRRAVGTNFEYEILSVMPWTRRELVAERLREGRLFIAGDAAHVMSPTGGFGMNTGIGDAVDLSWKLTAVLEGWGGETLLDSYTEERRPVAERNVGEASANLRRMLSPGRNPALLDHSEEGVAVREKVGDEFAQAMRHEWYTLGIHLGYVYDPSPVCWPELEPATETEPMRYRQSAHTGARAPHVWLEDGRSTLDLFGRGFVLLDLSTAAETDGDASPLLEVAEAVGLPIRVERLDEPEVRVAYETRYVLVRPDGHVAWRGDGPPQDSRALVATVRGAMRPRSVGIPTRKEAAL